MATPAAASPAREEVREFFPKLSEKVLYADVWERLGPSKLERIDLVRDIDEILVHQAGSETSGVQQMQIRQIRSELGFSRPVLIQYLSWIGGAIRGNFGKSYAQRRPVWDILRERFPRSMELAILTLAITLVWAIPLGEVSTVHQNGPLDYFARIASLSGLRVSLFVTGALILYGLVRAFHWIPPLEFVAFTEDPAENLKQLIWPALAQVYYSSAPITRLTRSQMLEVIRQDYVRTARPRAWRSGRWSTATP